MTNNEATGIWVDRNKAYIVDFYGNDCDVRQIESDVEKKHRSTGGLGARLPWWGRSLGSSEKTDERRREQLKRFFAAIDEATEGKDNLMILGPGKAKHDLKKYFLTHGHREEHLAQLETTKSRITEGEIVALMRDLCGKTLPRKGKESAT